MIIRAFTSFEITYFKATLSKKKVEVAAAEYLHCQSLNQGYFIFCVKLLHNASFYCFYYISIVSYVVTAATE